MKDETKTSRVHLAVAAGTVLLAGALFGARPGLKVMCTRGSHLYEVGETAEFLVTSTNGVETPVTVRLTLDGAREFLSVATVTPARVSWALDEPGFLRCTAKPAGKDAWRAAESGAAFSPERLRPAAKRPADYDAFWAKAFEELAAIPPDFQVRPLRNGMNLVSCRTANGRRMWAFFYCPPGAKPESCAMVVEVNGGAAIFCEEGLRANIEGLERKWRMPTAALYLHLPDYEPLTGPGSNFKAAYARHQEWCDAKGFASQMGYMNENAETGGPKDIYLYPCILGATRLLDWAVRQAGVDRTRVFYRGASHGGCFGLYLAAFSPHLCAAFCGVPLYCDVCGEDAGRPSGALGTWLRARHGELMPYFETAFCAGRITCPVYLSCGYRDNSCHPGGIYCTYNAIRAPKRMYDKIENGHGDSPADYMSGVDLWLRAQIGTAGRETDDPTVGRGSSPNAVPEEELPPVITDFEIRRNPALTGKKAYFYIDDVSWLFRDLTRERPAHLLDNPFLKVLKEAHDRYGMKVQLNCFYRTDNFFDTDEFTLKDMTDAYRAEWQANRDWLKLSFHALQEFPDYPFVNADYKDAKYVVDRISGEVNRFAGEGVFTRGGIIHWGTASRETCEALRDAGFKILLATCGPRIPYGGDPSVLPYGHAFRLEHNRKPETCLYRRISENEAISSSIGEYNNLTYDQAKAAFGSFKYVYDKKLGVGFKELEDFQPLAAGLNLYRLEDIEPEFRKVLGQEFVAYGFHEQYFHRHYFNYQPDYAEKLFTAARILHDNGYEYFFLEELVP